MQWTVICFSTVDWNSYHQRPQLMATAIAELGHRVIFVNNLGMRFPRPSDVGRIVPRLRHRLSRERGPSAVPEELTVSSPVLPPIVQFSSVRRVGSIFLARRFRRLVGSNPVLIWTYLPSPVVSEVGRQLGAKALVYDWCDDISERLLFASRRHRARVRRWEEEMARRADLVLFANEDFATRRGVGTRAMKVVPHGVSTSRVVVGDAHDLAELPRPRVGYLGAVTDWIDIDLIVALAEARPSWSFPIVGPLQTTDTRLTRVSNITLMGERPYREVPSLLSGFDVGLIPYRLTAATRAASPLKLREYLAAGIPVVSVDIPDTRTFSPPVRLAAGREGFLREIEEALRDGKLDGSVEVGSWRDIAGAVMDELTQVLAAPEQARVTSTPLSHENLDG